MRSLMITTLFVFLSSATSADIYKWTDKHGVVHYEDKQPARDDKKTDTKVEKVELSPIQILDDGSVRNTALPQDDSLPGKVLAMVEELKMVALKKIAEWRGTQTGNNQLSTNVQLYTTAWCKACKVAKQWLQDQHVPYTEYDIQQDANAALRMRKLGGGGGVPFAVINGKTVEGFSPSDYYAALH